MKEISNKYMQNNEDNQYCDTQKHRHCTKFDIVQTKNVHKMYNKKT